MPGGVYNFQGCASCCPRDRRVGSAPPPPRQPVSLVLSRHGGTYVMAMKDAPLGGWSGGGTQNARLSTPAHALGGRATVPAHQRRQPPRSYPNDAGHRAGRPSGLPYPATWASLPDTGAWTIARNCQIAQVRYTLYNGAALSAVRFLLIHYRKQSRQPGYRRLHLVGAAAVSFCKHVTCLQRKHG